VIRVEEKVRGRTLEDLGIDQKNPEGPLFSPRSGAREKEGEGTDYYAEDRGEIIAETEPVSKQNPVRR